MPWSVQLAQDCLDPMTNTPRIWPWPQEPWLFNAFALQAMVISMTVYNLFSKSEDEWTESDDKLYEWVHKDRKKKVEE